MQPKNWKISLHEKGRGTAPTAPPVELPDANEARAKLEKIEKRTKSEQRESGKISLSRSSLGVHQRRAACNEQKTNKRNRVNTVANCDGIRAVYSLDTEHDKGEITWRRATK